MNLNRLLNSKNQPKKKEEKVDNNTCKIRIKRDKEGRPKEVEVLGNCPAQKVDLAKRQLGIDEDIN